MLFFKWFFKKKETGQNFGDELQDPLDPVFKSVQKKYPVKKYILQENISEQLAPQSELIMATLKEGDDFSKILYSYITFHQIHFHLKNYLLKLKKKNFGYRNEFLDIFEDIFIDNLMIFKELKFILKNEEHTHYFQIWLDGYFISLFRNLFEDSIKKCHRIEPQLFFIIILFLALPEVDSGFEEIPFTSLIEFQESTQQDWKTALQNVMEMDFHHPKNKKSIECERAFLEIFMNLTASVNASDEIFFDEWNTLKCVDFINILMEKTDQMIDNVKRVRKNLLNEN